jgi:hypothetical protein
MKSRLLGGISHDVAIEAVVEYRIVMLRWNHNCVAAAAALLLVVQTAAPLSARFVLSMYCAGMPNGAPACSKIVATPEVVASGNAYRLLMATCPRMHTARALPACCAGMVRRTTLAQLGARCRITVELISSDRGAALQNQHRILLATAPALAPPAPQSTRAGFAPPAPIIVSAYSDHPISPQFLASHGLRAPPVA